MELWLQKTRYIDCCWGKKSSLKVLSALNLNPPTWVQHANTNEDVGIISLLAKE